MVERKRLALGTAVLAALGCSPPPPPLVVRLASQAASATRLEIDRSQLAPVRLVHRPDGLGWNVKGGVMDRTADGAIHVHSQGPFELRARVPATAGVEYAFRARARGHDLGLSVDTGNPEPLARRGDRSTAAVFPGPPGVVDLVVRTPPIRREPEVVFFGRGEAVLLSFDVEEATPREYHQRVSSEDAVLRALVRQPVTGGITGEVTRALDSLLAMGDSVYEWELPEASSPRLLVLETAVLARHAREAVPPPAPIDMRVEIRERGSWRSVFGVTRGGSGDEGSWRPARLEIGRATALRLVTAGQPGGSSSTATAAWGAAMVVPANRIERPDVIHFSLEALRPDRVGAYGSRQGLTPHLDRLAAAGVVFEEARAPFGETWQSLTGMAFGRFPFSVGVFARGDAVERGVRSIADAFAEGGYLTAQIGYFLISPGQLGRSDVEEHTTNDLETLARVEELLRRPRDQPLYLRVHLDATHYPFDVRPPFRPPSETGPLTLAEFERILVDRGPAASFRRLEDLYEAALRQSDTIIGKVVAALEGARRAGGGPLIAISADHGSHRGERGIWFLHSTLCRAVLHVPFVVHGPGRLPAGRRVDRLVRMIDAGPTLLDYAGLPPTGFEGRSLRSQIDGVPEAGLTNVIRQPADGLLVVENDRFKLIANPRRGGLNWPRMPSLAYPMPTLELFEWRRDPAEARDLSGREPLIVGELWRQATAARALVERRMSADAQRLLEQAGYAEPIGP